jgi:STE24 endopeptidase
MPFLLMVFLVLVCIPEVSNWWKPAWWYLFPHDAANPNPLTESPLWSVGLSAVAMGLTVVYAWLVARRVRGPLTLDPTLREEVLRRYEKGRARHHVALFVVYLLVLLVFGWPWAIGQLWVYPGAAQPGAENVRPGYELLLLAPFFVGQFLAWAVFYDAERASHQAAQLLALEAHAGAWLELERPRRTRPRPFNSRLAYVFFQLRQKLALVFLPLSLMILQKELVRNFPDSKNWQDALNLTGFLIVVGVFLFMPWLIRLMLGLKPLPAGLLRTRLEASARRLGFRCSNILLWNTRSGMANAMVVGIVPWIRYVVFTDRLVEDFSHDEVEAVFGHEVGHIRHHHMLYYVVFLTVSVLVLMVLGAPVYKDLEKQINDALIPLVLGALVALGYIFVVFGFLSRRCERQADVFGCRAVSCPQADCIGHADDVILAHRGRGLCATGIRTFIRALEKVALVNGISRDRPGFLQSWQHSTIARRVDFLQGMLDDPTIERRFQRRVALVKWALFILLWSALTVLLGSNSWWM